MKQGILAHLTPFAKLVFLITLMISCLILSLVAGILLAIPLFHVNLFSDFSVLSDFSNPTSAGLLKFFQILQSVGLFIVPALLAGLFFGGDPLDYNRLKTFPSPITYLLVTLLFFVSLPFGNWLGELNESMRLPGFLAGMEQWMKESEADAATITDLFLDVSTLVGFLVNLLMIAILPAIGEELIFRGMLQRLLGEWFRNTHVAIILASVIFGCIHLQFYGVVPRILMGVMFGYLFAWSGSLWIPVFAHLLNNGAAVVVAFLAGKGMIGTTYEEFGATGNLFIIAGSLFFTLFLMFLVWRRSLPGTPSA